MTTPKHIPEDIKEMEWNPNLNSNVIALVRQSDGNWKCFGLKQGKMLEVRQISPAATLEYWQFHGGKVI